MNTIVKYFPPLNRPGELRNQSYEDIFRRIQSGVNELYALAGTVAVVTADPEQPQSGQVWYRSDLDQLSIYVGGVVKRSAVFT